MIRILGSLLLAAALGSPAWADRFEYASMVNLRIPDGDSTGIRDTIFIDQHILIDDINFYVGIGDPDNFYAEQVLIDVFSPARQRIRLNDWGPPTIWTYFIWYDTEHEEDGPGQLEDYAGQDAFGAWEMFCFDFFNGPALFWYEWRIEVIGTPIMGLAEEKSPLPTDFAFSDVHPNPFNSTVAFAYALPTASPVRFAIFDIQGRKVRAIDCGVVSAGYHSAVWDGRDATGAPVASGAYFVRMSAGEWEFAKRAVMVK